MYYLTRRTEFEASHRYWNPTFTEEDNLRIFGKCASPYGHGHNYTLQVSIGGGIEKRTGMVINIKELDVILKEISDEFDHRFLNLDHPAFLHRIPTTENIAVYIFDHIEDKFSQAKAFHLARVRLYEEPTLWSDVIKEEGTPMVTLTKKFGFSAAHRLHSLQLSDEENLVVFGKCNNLHGHGHNYELEVTVRGNIDSQTGMIMDLGKIMHVVQEQILERFDHKHLNKDTTEFLSLNPTGENIVRVIWTLLQPELGSALVRLGLWETPKNLFEYYGE
jgi:6-pyruvoyltetrahydropterin/6-carboxytetrahydropterin synthase